MAWEIFDPEVPEGVLPDYRVFVTDGNESFHIDRPSAQRLADLLNDGAKKVSVKREGDEVEAP